MSTLKEYFSAAYGKLPGKWVVISSFDPDRNFPCRTENLADEMARRSCYPASLYHTYAVFDEEPASGRGSGKDVTAVIGAYLDIDIGESGRYVENGKNPAASLDDIKADLVKWGLPLPTALVSSGNGVHAEFWLDEPFLIQTEEDRARASAMLKGFNGYAIEKAKADGIKLDSMGDLARAKRAIGSQNWKDRANPKPVEVLELYPERTHAFEVLEGFKPTPRKAEAPRTKRAPAKEVCLPQWDVIAKHCPFVRHCVENARHLDYNTWLAVLGIAARCEDGSRHAHELSAHDPRYSHAETEAKLAEAFKFDGPATYDHIRDKLGFASLVDGDRLAARMRSPLSFGYATDALIGVLKATVYDLSSERFYDLETLAAHSHKAFDMATSALVPSPVTAFKTSNLSVMVSRADYLPGQPRLVGNGRRPILNVYRATGVKPAEGACDTILGHFAYLIPDEDQRDHVLNYLAHLVQNPGCKITSALLFVGGQGNGKSTVARWSTDIFGSSNVKTLPTDAIASRFQADRTNIQLLVLNEVFGIKRDAANGLKSWITEDEMEVEDKGVHRHVAKTPRGVILITNHIEGLDIEDRDRRYAVIQTTEDRADEAYFTRLNDAAPKEMPAFSAWLAKRDLSSFKPHAPAPDNPLKALMQRLSLSPLESAIHDAWDNEEGCFHRDFGTVEEVVTTVMARGLECRRPTSSSTAAVLKKMGFAQLPQQRVEGYGKPRFWVWRNRDRWLAEDTKSVAAHYVASLAPANDRLAGRLVA